MPSPGFKTLRTVFRARAGQRFDDPVTARRELEEFVAILPKPEPFRTEAATVGGVACEWLEPARDRPEQRTLVFFHGGGYVSGSLESHRPLAARIAAASDARVLQVDYRRAPEHPFPAAFDDARAVLGAVLDRIDRIDRIGVVGDSAGAGLALAALAGRVGRHDAGDRLPGALVCLSPWTDLACTGDTFETRAAADPLFDRASLGRMATLYAAGADPADPRLSPLYADLRGLPPTLIQVGDAEVMLADSTRLAERLEAAGVPVELDVWPEMVHGWQLFAGMVPEGDEAIERIGRFLRGVLGPEPLSDAHPDPDPEKRSTEP